MARGFKQFLGFRRAIKIVRAAIKFGKRHNVEALQRVVDIEKLIGLPFVQIAETRHTKRLSAKGRPEGIEIAQNQTIAVDKKGLVVRTVLIEIDLLPHARTIFGAIRNDI